MGQRPNLANPKKPLVPLIVWIVRKMLASRCGLRGSALERNEILVELIEVLFALDQELLHKLFVAAHDDPGDSPPRRTNILARGRLVFSLGRPPIHDNWAKRSLPPFWGIGQVAELHRYPRRRQTPFPPPVFQPPRPPAPFLGLLEPPTICNNERGPAGHSASGRIERLFGFCGAQFGEDLPGFVEGRSQDAAPARRSAPRPAGPMCSLPWLSRIPYCSNALTMTMASMSLPAWARISADRQEIPCCAFLIYLVNAE